MRRRVLLVLAVVGSLVAAAAVAVGFGLRAPSPGSGDAPGATGPIRAAAAIAYEPGVGATGVNPTSAASVRVAGGTFVDVGLQDATGKAVNGVLSDDRTRWTSNGPLGYGQRYTWTGTATGENGATEPLAGSFNTVVPARQLHSVLNIGDGKTVGVAAPFEIQFDGHVANRAAVEKALSIKTSIPGGPA